MMFPAYLPLEWDEGIGLIERFLQLHDQRPVLRLALKYQSADNI